MSDQSLSMDGTNPESAITSEELAARSARDRQRLHAVGFQHLQFAVGGYSFGVPADIGLRPRRDC